MSPGMKPFPHARSTADPFEQFASAVPFEGADEAVLARVTQLGHVLCVRRGSVVPLRESEDQLVFVARGASKLVAHVAIGREQILTFHFAGDLVWLSRRGIHAQSLGAITDCELIAFPTRRLVELVRNEAAILANLLEGSIQALRRARAEAITLGRKSARERVADFLIAMAERIGSPDGGSQVLDLPMSRRDIADSLGLTIETVSRQMSQLRLSGLIETQGRSFVRLRDPARLSIRAGQMPMAA